MKKTRQRADKKEVFELDWKIFVAGLALCIVVSAAISKSKDGYVDIVFVLLSAAFYLIMNGCTNS